MDGRLYAATTSGDVEEFGKLIEDRHDILLQEQRGTMPLQMAAYNGPLNVLHQVTPGGNTPLHLAAYNGHLQIVQMLLRLMNEDIEAGNEESNQFIVAKNSQGNTPLHEAAKGGSYQVVNVLLEHKADMASMVNNAGETALFKAAEEGHKEIVVKLVPLISSNYDRRTSDGHTPLHAAVSHGHTGVIQNLLDQSPDLLMQADSFGRTPLHTAAYVEEASEIAKLLLKKDTSLCYKVDRNHQSALHIAVIEGNVDLVKEMLNCGRDCLEIVDKDGRNVLHLAAENAVQIFEKISRHIKDLMGQIISKKLINNLDNHGKTPLDIVLEKMNNDERLFSAMKGLLKKHGARKTLKMVDEKTLERSLATKKLAEKIQIISVNAVLIATVAFDAALNLPDKENQTIVFLSFVLCDAVAFCSAIATAIMLVYAVYDKQEDSLLVRSCIKGLWIALVALALAFALALQILIESEHRFVSVIVWLMPLAVPLVIRDMHFRSKAHIFKEDVTYTTWIFLIGGALQCFLLIPINNGLMTAILVTLGFAVSSVAIISLPMKKYPVEPTSTDDSLLDRIFHTIWGRIVCIVIDLGIVVVLWIQYFNY